MGMCTFCPGDSGLCGLRGLVPRGGSTSISKHSNCSINVKLKLLPNHFRLLIVRVKKRKRNHHPGMWRIGDTAGVVDCDPQKEVGLLIHMEKNMLGNHIASGRISLYAFSQCRWEHKE